MTATAPNAAPPPLAPIPASGCNVHTALADERAHVAELRRADPQANAANPLDQPIGLALSGGGIRSATVGLGVLQAFAEKRLLHRFDYLSTVSGGGYVGAWFSAMLRSRQDPLTPGAGIGALETLIAPSDIRDKDEEPAEIAFLRAYSNYLTPRLGLFSSDTLAALTGYVRNLVLSLLLAVFSLGSVLAVLHVLVQGVALEAGNAALREFSSRTAVGVLGSSAVLIALLLTLQALDLRGQLPDDNQRRQLLAGLQKAQRLFGVLVLPAVAFGLASAGVLLESTRPFAPAGSTHFLVGFAFLAALVAGAGIAHLLVDIARGVDIDQVSALHPLSLALRMFRHHFRPRGAGGASPNQPWHEVLRYAVATLACTFVASKLVDLAGRLLEPVDPMVALFRGPALVVAISLAVFVVWLGVIGTTYSELTREWLSRLMGSLVGAVLAWLAIGAILINARPLWMYLSAGRWPLAVDTGWLLPLALLALLAALVRQTRPVTAAAEAPPRPRLPALAIPAACTLIVVLFLAALTVAFQELMIRMVPPGGATPPGDGSYRGFLHLHLSQIGHALGHVGFDTVPPVQPSWASASAWFDESWSALPIISLALTCFIGALLAFRYVDVNVFSLQNLYRNRLVRCYLGAAHQRQRLQNPYAGFDPADDIAIASLGAQRPFHLVNAALNITQGEDLAWQQRKAASFCFTPRWCGYWLEGASLAGLVGDDRVRGGYARTADYALEPPSQSGQPPALMLGTVMATSGAAVSSQMGFASRGVLAFVLTLLNVRLGRWFPNTAGRDAQKDLGRHSPRSAGSWYLSELLGRTNEKSAWVYLSDGGHFENLGIYELVRRRCRFIVAVDAGADPTMGFGDLGNCVRKCRVDFGVGIRIDLDRFAARSNTLRPAVSHVLGEVHYPATRDAPAFVGDILYVKSCVPATSEPVPADILAFLAENRLFPHQPTSDQWFTESQFESYRQLGYWLMMLAMTDAKTVFDAIAAGNRRDPGSGSTPAANGT